MTITQLREAIHKQPFEPFTICLTDGRSFRVKHPEYVAIFPEGNRTFIVFGPEEEYRILDAFLVTSLDYANGKTRRRRR
jgi:hypothetical protein